MNIKMIRGDEFEEKTYKKLIKKYPKHIKIKKDKEKKLEPVKNIKKVFTKILSTSKSKALTYFKNTRISNKLSKKLKNMIPLCPC